jgi:glycogen operon protein
VLAFTLGALSEEEQEIHVLLNMSGESLPFELPVLPGARAWARFLDTALPPPDDVTEPGAEVRVGQGTYVAGQHSTVVLVAK